MLNQTPRKNNSDNNHLRSFARYSGMAFQMIFILLAGYYGGKKLDVHMEFEKPVFTSILSVFAVIASLILIVKDLVKPHK